MTKTMIIYNKIVDANIGDRISMNDDKGMKHADVIEDYLKQQGYTKNLDYKIEFDWASGVTYLIKLCPIRPYEMVYHNYKVGDIIYNTWGYEQTNVDFYQVVAVTKSTIKIRNIGKDKTFDRGFNDRGSAIPVKDHFISNELIIKKPHFYSGEWYINFDCGCGSLWNGRPISWSSYA